jgi:hypothetical protein
MTTSDSVPAHVWLRSPAIKAWKQPERTLSILSDLASAWPTAGRLVLELHVERHAPEVAARCAALEVISAGAPPPPRGWIARTLGLGGQAFVAKLALRKPDEIRVALAGDAIWDSDFMLYSQPGAARFDATPRDPPQLVGPDGEWVLAQITGKYDWLLTSADPQRIQAMVATAVAVFERHDVDLKVLEEARSTQIAIGSKVFDL